MKKIISLLLGLMLALAIVSSEVPPKFPFGIDGKVIINGEPLEDYNKVKLENLRTGETIYSIVSNGVYFFGNLNSLLTRGYYERVTRNGQVLAYGDKIKITACA